MPESCTKCKFSYKEESYEPKEGTFYCVKTCKGEIIKSNYYTNENKKYAYTRPDYCPLVEIPEKHGRMIDFDALIEKYWDGNSMTITAWDLKDIKAVIEAEDGT